MLATRRAAAAAAPRALRTFHSTPRPAVSVGDALPDVELMENSPGNKVSIAAELKGKKGLIIGVPAAFSKCLPAITPSNATSPCRMMVDAP